MSSTSTFNSSVILFIILFVGFVVLSLESMGITHFAPKRTVPAVSSPSTSTNSVSTAAMTGKSIRKEKYDFTVVSQSRLDVDAIYYR